MKKNEEKYFEVIRRMIGAEGVIVDFEKDSRIETAAFNHEKNLIKVNPDFVKEYVKKISNAESGEKYILSHELMHWLQVTEDYEGYVRSFDYIKEWGKERNSEEIWRCLFNVVYDIDGNTKITNLFLPFAEGGSEARTPLELYNKVLFKEDVLTSYPKSLQFCYALIREKMVGKAIVDEEVRKILDEKIKVFGKEKSLKEIIYDICDGSHKASELNWVIQRYVKPRLEKLIEDDEKNGRMQKGDMGVIDFGDGVFSQDKEEYGKYLKKKYSSVDEKLKNKKDKVNKDLLESAGIEGGESERIANIIKNTEKYVAEVKDIWYNIIRVNEELSEKKRLDYPSGNLDVPTAIKQWPLIITSPGEARPFYRYEEIIKEEILPKSVKCVLVLDMSGSMGSEEREKVEECVYPILKSLYDFKLEIALNSEKGVSPIGVETYVIGFGGEGTVRELPERKLTDPLENIVLAMKDFDTIDLGGTCDDEALKMAYEKFSQEDFEKIKKGELLGLVIEITDGGTATPNTSRNFVLKMNNEGIFARGIKISSFMSGKKEEEETGGTEKEIFEGVWGKYGKAIHSIEELKPLLKSLLKEALTYKNKE